MINRIRVVTLLVMVLGYSHCYSLFPAVCFFLPFTIPEELCGFQSITGTAGRADVNWDLMLQTRINLSRSAVRMMRIPPINKVTPKLNCSIAPGKIGPGRDSL